MLNQRFALIVCSVLLSMCAHAFTYQNDGVAQLNIAFSTNVGKFIGQLPIKSVDITVIPNVRAQIELSGEEFKSSDVILDQMVKEHLLGNVVSARAYRGAFKTTEISLLKHDLAVTLPLHFTWRGHDVEITFECDFSRQGRSARMTCQNEIDWPQLNISLAPYDFVQVNSKVHLNFALQLSESRT